MTRCSLLGGTGRKGNEFSGRYAPRRTVRPLSIHVLPCSSVFYLCSFLAGWGGFCHFLPYLYTAPSMHGTPRMPCGKGWGIFGSFLPYLCGPPRPDVPLSPTPSKGRGISRVFYPYLTEAWVRSSWICVPRPAFPCGADTRLVPQTRAVQKTGVYLYANRDRRVLAVSDEDPLRPVSHLFLCLYGVPRTTKERTTGRPPAQSPPGRSRFRGFRSHLDTQPAPHDILKHSPLPGVSLFGKTCSYLHKQQGRYDSMFIPPILQPSSLDD